MCPAHCRVSREDYDSGQEDMHAYLLLQSYHARPLLLQQPYVLPLRVRRVLHTGLRLERIECIGEVVRVQILEDRLLTS